MIIKKTFPRHPVKPYRASNALSIQVRRTSTPRQDRFRTSWKANRLRDPRNESIRYDRFLDMDVCELASQQTEKPVSSKSNSRPGFDFGIGVDRVGGQQKLAFLILSIGLRPAAVGCAADVHCNVLNAYSRTVPTRLRVASSIREAQVEQTRVRPPHF